MNTGTMKDIYQICKERELALHLDGARIFNAAVASGIDVKEFTRYCDSVMFCLSKGLGAPVGSLLAGTKEFINRALRYRKALGGGLRQAGILAAAGLVALENVSRLGEDHANARRLAEALSRLPGIDIDLHTVQTNIISFKLSGQLTAEEFVSQLAQRGVKCNAYGSRSILLVTHLDISREDIESVIAIIGDIMRRYAG